MVIDGAGDQSESIVCYDEFGCTTGDQYFWLTEDGYGMPDGWYDDSDNLIEGVTLPLGTGLYFYCTTSGASVQYAGEVYQGELTMPLPAVGYNMIGNSTPVAIDLQQIKLVDAAGDQSESIVCYDEFGCTTGDQYFWLTEDGYGMPDGWYDDSDNLIDDVTLEPGEGVYLYCTTEGASFTVPNPMAKDAE